MGVADINNPLFDENNQWSAAYLKEPSKGTEMNSRPSHSWTTVARRGPCLRRSKHN